MKELNMKELNIEQIEYIYHHDMKRDFPPSELFPLKRLKQLLAENRYLCLGLYEKDQLAGYIYFVTDDSPMALGDYFAIFEKYRNKGLGSAALKTLSEELTRFKFVIYEVEDPDYAKDEEAKDLMKRRIEFYRRNGMKITDIKVRTFGVNYLLIYSGVETYEKEEIIRLYQHFYDIRATPVLRKLNVKILG